MTNHTPATDTIHTYLTKRRYLALLLLALSTGGAAYAQSYKQLWNDVEQSTQHDLPRSALSTLNKVAHKAAIEGHNGHRVKAALAYAELTQTLSSDSLPQTITRLEVLAAESADVGVQAMMHLALAECQEVNYSLFTVQRDSLVKYHLAEVEARLPKLLALHVKDYLPAVELLEAAKGVKQPDLYKGDLLHAIAGAWLDAQHERHIHGDSLYQRVMALYAQAGNRDAVAYWHYEWLSKYQGGVTTPAELHRLAADVYKESQVAPLFWVLWAERMPWRDAYATLQRVATQYKKSPFIHEVQNHIIRATAPEFHLELPRIISTHEGERTYAQRCRNIKQLRLRLYRTTLHSTDHHPNAVGKDEVLVGEWKSQLPADSALDYVEAQLHVKWPSSPGIYRAVVEGDSKLKEHTFIHVTDLGLLRLNTPQHLRVVSINNRTGAPVPHTTITGYDENNKVLWQETTDEQGELLIDHTRVAYNLGLRHEGDKYGPLSDGVGYTPYRVPNDAHADVKPIRRVKLHSDRSLYRPGQVMQISGVVYQQSHDNVAVVAQERVPVSIRNAQQAVLHRDTLMTDAMGAFATQFALPTTALTGNLYIETPHGTLHRKVESYKAPTFEVRLDTLAGSPRAGERISVQGRVCSFDGAPVVGANVALTLNKNTLAWWARSEESYTDQAQATTNAEGIFTAEMLLGDSVQPHYLSSYLITAEASSPTGEVQRGNYRFSVSNRPRHLYASWPTTLCQDALPEVTYQLLGSTGQPLRGSGVLEVYSKDDSTKIVATQPFDAQQAFSPTCLAALPQGYYRLVARVAAQGTLPEVVHEVAPINLFNPKAEKAAVPLVMYRMDESINKQTAEIIVGSNLPEATLYYSLVSSNGKVVRHERVALRGGYMRLPLTYQDNYGDGATLIAAIQAHHAEGAFSQTATISVQRPTPDKTLHYRWERFVSKVRPSDEAEWQLRLTDSEGRAVYANVMLSVADASIDKIYDNYAPLYLHFWRHLPALYSSWALIDNYMPGVYAYAQIKQHDVAVPQKYVFPNLNYYSSPMRFIQGERAIAYEVAAKPAVRTLAGDAVAVAQPLAIRGSGAMLKKANATAVQTPLQLRTDFSPTAYYNGLLRTDKAGRASIRFTLPHSATTWQVRGIATTADMRYVSFDTTLVARPDVAIRSNMPRFVYEGDSVSFGASFLNTNDKQLPLKNSIEVRRADNDVVLATRHWTGTLTPQMQTQDTVSCRVPQGVSALKVRIWAEGKTYSDGEEYTIPVHQQKATQIVRTSLPLDKAGVHTISFDTLQIPQGATLTGRQLSLTSNPAWLAVMSLPTLANTRYRDAYTLANTLYATTLTQHILQTQPHVARAINTWQEQGDKLPQNLRHKAHLAGSTLQDTPWLTEANDASTQIKHLAAFAQAEVSRDAFDRALAELAQLQDEFGGFSWCQGMPANPYITTQVALQLARMQFLTQSEVAQYNYEQAIGYLERKAEAWLSDYKAKRATSVPQWLIDYFYIYASTRRALPSKHSRTVQQLIDIIEKEPAPQALEQKAKRAAILHHVGRTASAQLHLRSLQEHLVHKPGYGTYYDVTHRNYNRNSIATQVAALEALRTMGELTLEDQEQMRLWLVLQRRAQQWPSDMATAEAVHALLQGHDEMVRPEVNTKSAKAAQEEANNKRKANTDSKTNTAENSIPATRLQLVNLEEHTTPIYYTFYKDKQVLATNSGTRAAANNLGYTEVRFNTADHALQATTLKLHKTTANHAYGTLYSSYALPLSQTTTQAEGIGVERRLEYWDGKQWQATTADSTSLARLAAQKPLRLRQILTIVADQDYSFVRIEAPRSAAAEPTQQLSGYTYRGGTAHYRSVGDAGTTYFVEHLSKGTHHFTEEWYISRIGLFQWPAAQATCLFAPEFAGQTAGQWLNF